MVSGNFFRYMREHFGLDRLIEYGTEPIPDAISVVNPAWRKLDSQIRSKAGQRHRIAAQFGALALSEDPAESEVQGFQQRKGHLQEEIQVLDSEIVNRQSDWIHKWLCVARRSKRMSYQHKRCLRGCEFLIARRRHSVWDTGLIGAYFRARGGNLCAWLLRMRNGPTRCQVEKQPFGAISAKIATWINRLPLASQGLAPSGAAAGSLAG